MPNILYIFAYMHLQKFVMKAIIICFKDHEKKNKNKKTQIFPTYKNRFPNKAWISTKATELQIIKLNYKH